MTKEANLIIIGGTIASGKSSLANSLAKAKGFIEVPELNSGNKVQSIILKKLYEGVRIHAETIQFYFIKNRVSQYINAAWKKQTSILDRGIWEDWFFAKLLMEQSSPKSYKHFKKYWKDTLEKLIKENGRPKAYIFVKVDWNNFKERIIKRGRTSEMDNFSKNEDYFKTLLNEYNENFLQLIEWWKIPVICIDTCKLSKRQVLETTLNGLKKLKIC